MNIKKNAKFFDFSSNIIILPDMIKASYLDNAGCLKKIFLGICNIK